MHLKGLFSGRRLATMLLLTLAFLLWTASPVAAAGDVRLVVEGRQLEASPPPKIKDGRTLIPVRVVSEALGASVQWDDKARTVVVTKGERSVKMWIDNRLVNYKTSFGLCDVPPQIYDSRTFVPLRLVSNALGVSVRWDGAARTVFVDSGTPAAVTPFFNVTIPPVAPGQIITGVTTLQAGFSGEAPAGAAEVRFLLLDPETGRGPVVARGNNVRGSYSWLPDPFYSGSRVLAAAVCDSEGRFLAGGVVPVKVAVAPRVSLTGVTQQQVVKDSISLGVDLNFVAEYVKYEITNQDTGNAIVTDKADPQGKYDWTPQLADNGIVSIRAAAYDRTGQVYYSPPVTITVDTARKLELKGVSAGTAVEKPVTLWLSRNFPVSRVEYLLRNAQGVEKTLFQSDGYSSYKWFPGPDQAGTWELAARVKDSAGAVYTSNSISVKVPGTARLLLETVGPNQVLTGTVKLKSIANVPLSRIEYQLINPQTGARRVIAGGSSVQAEYSWTPQAENAGFRQIQAVGTAASGKISSEAVPVRIYLGKIYGPVPVIDKSKFKDFASQLAAQFQKKTGMSAALQTAQAILETGWGQYTPVDKYTGKLSYNLFGIKGRGPAGSVTHNTWEEYNGVTYRVDALFRAYHSPAESWADHKSLLLTAGRYAPFRAVMHDSTRGAYALRRCGYATDSRYPEKLISIIKQYQLYRLDEVGI
ncbi:MAG: glucosaminidase domain-containing protein [Bacillota bacterium]